MVVYILHCRLLSGVVGKGIRQRPLSVWRWQGVTLSVRGWQVAFTMPVGTWQVFSTGPFTPQLRCGPIAHILPTAIDAASRLMTKPT